MPLPQDLRARWVRSSPPVHQCAKVISFLGYDPFPESDTFAERLVAFRRSNGLRVRDAAKLAGVDPASWSSWERDEYEITASYRKRIEGICGWPTDVLQYADSVKNLNPMADSNA